MFSANAQQPPLGIDAPARSLATTQQGQVAFVGHGAAMGGDDNEDRFSALVILFRVLQYRRFIAAMLAFGVAAGIMVTALEPSRYQAVTRLEIMPQTAKIFEDLQVIRSDGQDREVTTARERLLSMSLARRVAFELGLADDAAFLTSGAGLSLGNIVNRALRVSDASAIKRIDFSARETMAAGRLRGSLVVRPVTGTNILEILISQENPQLAARIADQYAKSYIDQRIDTTGATSQNAQKIVQEQVATVKARLEEAETALVAYAREQHLTLTESNGSLVQSDLASINAALLEIQKKRIEDEHLNTFISQGRGADLPEVLEKPGVQNLRDKIAELKGQYEENLGTLKPAMPEMRQLATRIQELERQLAKTVGVVLDSIKISYSETLEKEKALKTRLAQLEAEQSEFQDKNIRYTILKREVDSYRTQYQNLITKLNDVGVASEIRTPTAAIADLALVPGSPASPSLLINLLAAVLISLLLTTTVIYFVELLNNTFARPEQVEAELGIPLLGVLPNVPSNEIREQMDEPTSSLSEAYRSLRTALQFTGQDGTPRNIAITSAEPSEGKSTSIFKLALDLAALGARVLVIDADMRKPTLHRMFGTDHAIGLSNLLSNTGHSGDIHDMFRPTKYPNVSFISSGTLPPNPVDLLSSPRMAQVINLCGKAFDITLIDCPPVIGLADAPIIARLAEGTMMVVSAHQVTRRSAQNALKRIRATGGVPLGAVLTKFTIDRFDYNYAYRYMYYNSYYQYGPEGAAAPSVAGPAANASIEAPENDKRVKQVHADTTLVDWARRVRRVARRFIRRYEQTP